MERAKVIPEAYVLLIRDETVFLMRRFNTGYRDGEYALPAGHVEEGESVAQGACREVLEETGIHIRPEDLTFVHLRWRNYHGGRIGMFFRASSWEGEPKNLEPNKCDETGWYSLKDLPETTSDYIRQTMELIQRGETYSEEW